MSEGCNVLFATSMASAHRRGGQHLAVLAEENTVETWLVKDGRGRHGTVRKLRAREIGEDDLALGNTVCDGGR